MPKYLTPSTEEEAREPWWWTPLEGVAKSIAGIEEYRFFDLADFMIMCVVVRGKKTPRVFLYKHVYTRRYLNLDEGGHAYDYIPPPDDAPDSNHGRYKRDGDPRRALDRLRLWELPWMKDSLEPFCDGRPWNPDWENRWSDLPPPELSPPAKGCDPWGDGLTRGEWDWRPDPAA